MEGDGVHLHRSRESLHGGNSAVVFENFAGGEELETLEMPFVQAIVKPEIDGDEDELDMSLTRPAAKKRRLTSNQLQLLERNFAVENKLEPERKLQLANELGMQPRQVAIWFQNRRARFKNKQLEKEYDSLKGSFEKLKAEFECLVKEKENLEYEVASLKGKLADDRENGIVPLESHYLDQSTRAGDGEKACNLPVVISPTPKHEEASSAKSDVFDSDSPLSFLGQDQSDHFSQDEGDHHLSCFLSSSLPRICQDPSPGSCNYGFPVEDQPFWTTYGGMY